jgi:predicted nucleotidyltransferase
MNVFKEIRELELPKDEYVVVGSSVLVVLGIIDSTEDVDITVSEEIFDSLRSAGWQTGDGVNNPSLQQGLYDISTGFGKWKLADLQEDSAWIAGVPFMSLEKLLEWKKQKNREKDRRHIKLIERYLAELQPADSRQ